MSTVFAPYSTILSPCFIVRFMTGVLVLFHLFQPVKRSLHVRSPPIDCSRSRSLKTRHLLLMREFKDRIYLFKCDEVKLARKKVTGEEITKALHSHTASKA
jgi:hypothetical protein